MSVLNVPFAWRNNYLQVRVMVSVDETTVLNVPFAWRNNYLQVRVMVSVGKTTALNVSSVDRVMVYLQVIVMVSVD